MKTVDSIPVSKAARTGTLLKAGAKVGVNYLRYYGDRVVGDKDQAQEKLERSNAKDIYKSLETMKGSGLKVAQMLSMEKTLLPQAYVEQFSLSQFSVPPLSIALVRKTFRKDLGSNPEELFDSFASDALFAASIGQVHRAEKNDHTYAVKIQYPGVRDSVSSDLQLLRPFALRILGLPEKGSEIYFSEVEQKLLEETDYALECMQSQSIAAACSHIPGLRFPKYYPELSSPRILTMDFMQGQHISQFVDDRANEPLRQRVAQSLWDFYMYQFHVLRKVHADPHPGNFIVSSEGQLQPIDFGCMKELPDAFYRPYFSLVRPEIIEDERKFNNALYALEILRTEDSAEETAFFTQLFKEILVLITQPFSQSTFDFSSKEFMHKLTTIGARYAKMKELRSYNTNRGSKHFIYMNRTLFGLFQLMHQISTGPILVERYKNFTNPTHTVAN